jgi:hypothetical protein
MESGAGPGAAFLDGTSDEKTRAGRKWFPRDPRTPPEG